LLRIGSIADSLPKSGLDIGAAVAASLADKHGLKIGQPDIIGPAIGSDLDRMGAFVVAAVDQQPARAGVAHFSKSDFLLACHQCDFASNLAKLKTGLC
jgi:hypothetical protein